MDVDYGVLQMTMKVCEVLGHVLVSSKENILRGTRKVQDSINTKNEEGKLN